MRASREGREINRGRNNDNFMENINNTAGKQKDRGEKSEMNGVIKGSLVIYVKRNGQNPSWQKNNYLNNDDAEK